MNILPRDLAQKGLTYVSDMGPGISRRRRGKGFSYSTPDGAAIKDNRAIDRIRSLAIPPAWSDVWISPEPDGHIQATGRDEKGRKQYRYHPDWTAFRDETKFSGIVAFAEALPTLRSRLDADLRLRGVPRDRVLASIVTLLDKALIRIGNDRYRRENKSFGLTTLRSNHVEINGSSIRFAFRGKSGKQWRLKLVDRRIARIVAAIEELPGQHLFQYVDECGQLRPVHSHDVNDYIRKAAGKPFTSKHFRTWAATNLTCTLLCELEAPSSKRQRTMSLNATLDLVAKELQNTRSVCRRSYVHPAVIESWKNLTLHDECRDLQQRYRRPLKGLDPDESLVLRWLRDK